MDHHGLNRTVVRGVAWTMLARWSGQIVSWAGVILLARVLSKADYGLVGMAGLYLGLVRILTDGGLATSIVALRRLSQHEIAQFNAVALLFGLAGAVLTLLAAVPAGWFFRAPALPPVMALLSVTALISSIRLVPGAVLQRDLRFRALAAIDSGQGLATTLTTIALALAGWRYWSLVAGGLVGNTVGVILTLALARQGLARPRIASLGRYVAFTRELLIGRVAWYVYTNADFLVAGRMLGPAALGAYSFAWNIASVPVEKVTALVQRVSSAAFARLRDDRAAMGRMLLRLTEGLLVGTLPASIGMALVAQDFVPLYLGPGWEETILPLQILAGYAAFRAVVTLLPQVLTMLGDTRFLMYNALGRAVALPLAFALGARYGPGGIAMGWVIVYPLFIAPVYLRTLRRLDLSIGEYLAPLRVTIRGTAVMAARGPPRPLGARTGRRARGPIPGRGRRRRRHLWRRRRLAPARPSPPIVGAAQERTGPGAGAGVTVPPSRSRR